ncbi:hypothetical protein OUZ56_016966 [Daphnia magna]|uniref:Uncharacterized protein n=1 Tax=Daphnia magna TaxID=35525 RepID=A0ABR0ARS3_9CRUS|nr:hypothetical protein OUZ56_016966 [Daphnia magna]
MPWQPKKSALLRLALNYRWCRATTPHQPPTCPAKFNQDPVERFFGISWQLTATQHALLDCISSAYFHCLLKKFKEDNAASRSTRESLRDLLLEKLSLRFVEDIEDEPAEVGINEENCNEEVNEILSDETLENIHNDAFVLEDEEIKDVDLNRDAMVFGGTKNQGIYDMVGYVLYSCCRHILKCQDSKSLLQCAHFW